MKIRGFIKRSESKKKSKITNKTIAQHRDEIIASGKKFKYPLQYERHKLVIHAIVIVAFVSLLAFGLLLFGLYKAQTTDLVTYKISRFVPLPVAKIDKSYALYSDYLAQFRSSVHYYSTKENARASDEEFKSVSSEFKNQSLENAIKLAYARQIANEQGIKITDEEVDKELEERLKYDRGIMSLSAFNYVVNEYYGLNPTEYKRVLIYNPLLLQKVSVAIDGQAKDTAYAVYAKTKTEADLTKVATEYRESGVEFMDSGAVNAQNSDGGNTKKALGLKIGEISEPYISESLDGYYIMKLISKNDEVVNYQLIKMPFLEFNKRVAQLKSDGKVDYYIDIAKQK